MTDFLYVGVDGGGTSCRARLQDANGNTIGEGLSGSANVYQNPEGTLVSIIDAVDQALVAAGFTPDDKARVHAGLGLAGCEITTSQKFLDAWDHPFASMVYQNDAHTACLGAHGGENGAMLIIGTGIKGWLIEGEDIHGWTGWGFPLADQGSGAWLGLRVLQETLRAVDGLREHTGVTKEVLEKFDGDASQIAVWAATAKSGDYGQFAPLAVHNKKNGDAVAVQIMQEQADIVAEMLDQMISRTNGKIALLGGLTPFVKENLPQHYLQHFVDAQDDAQTGALAMIRRARGV
ncbi:BadF/BadG/BcrA/BcrD ATPase family protein [Salinibius halmophilus]|uniref:BadF/BadG/BcrA/BcrD ATPase family protein n=1 Tax=Salinibius halmophilus TaxID=1853216 RepID=UPI000E675C7F|nr:BadF/BadG/BcrA/BcrD ATPase family protein [Salinibius halmophilus]